MQTSLKEERLFIGKNTHDDTETLSLSLLTTLLSRSKRAKIEKFSDKKEHTDGVMYFYDDNNLPLIITGETEDDKYIFPEIHYQIKGTEKGGEKKYRCEKNFLHRVFLETRPLLFIFVDTVKNIIYYEFLSKAYITSSLGIKNMSEEERKEITIGFSKVLNNPQQIVDDYLKEDARLKNISTEEESSPEEIKDYKNSIKGILNKNIDVTHDLQALLYFNHPIRITENNKIERICDKLSISDIEFKYIVNVLEQIKAVKIIGDLITVVNIKIAKYLLADLIKRKGMIFLTQE